MRYKKCYLVCGLMVAALTVSSVTGCGSTDSNQTTETESSVEATSEENTFEFTDDTDTETVSTTLMASVDSIDGNAVTLSVMGAGGMGGEGNAPGGEASSGDGSAPEMPEDAGDGSAPEMPEDAEDGSAPEMPEGAEDGSAPEMPEDAEDGSAPEMPEGAEDGSAPEMPEDAGDGSAPGMSGAGAMETSSAILTIGDESVIQVEGDDKTLTAGSIEDITEGVMLQITFDENGAITEIIVSTGMGGGNMAMGGGGASTAVTSYDAVIEYAEDTEVDGETYSSTGTDENAILISSGTTSLKNITVDRTSSDSTGGDNSSFYGVGAAILNTDGTAYISNADITTDAAGGAGVFAYGTGTVYVSDSTISTTQNTSGGIHAAGGGTLYAWDLEVETDGESAAAIRSDRGGGTMVVDGGTYISNGVGSPAVYCTADIAINNATLTATGSEAICMEGLNTIHLFDCDITGNMDDLETNDTTWTIIVYQSLSGDSEVGTSTMQLIGGTLTSENGGLIYTTNTEADILMSNVDITYADESEFFLMCTGNTNQRGWGTAGANGSQCNFTADSQEMEGDVVWDSISELDFYMTNGSSLTGAIIDDETYAGNGGDGYCNVFISEDSIWTVTGDSSVSSLSNEGTIVDAAGNIVSIIGTDGTVYVEGTSSYTVTVENYSDSADLSGAAETDSWENHEVSKPEALA